MGDVLQIAASRLRARAAVNKMSFWRYIYAAVRRRHLDRVYMVWGKDSSLQASRARSYTDSNPAARNVLFHHRHVLSTHKNDILRSL